MKLKRTKKEYGGGSGYTVFESKLFRVVLWSLSNGIRTTLECNLSDLEIDFDGKQKLNSNKLCMEQLTANEILNMIKYQKKIAFEEGVQHKIDEFKKLFNI